jgi:hypothetical protein
VDEAAAIASDPLSRSSSSLEGWRETLARTGLGGARRDIICIRSFSMRERGGMANATIIERLG